MVWLTGMHRDAGRRQRDRPEQPARQRAERRRPGRVGEVARRRELGVAVVERGVELDDQPVGARVQQLADRDVAARRRLPGHERAVEVGPHRGGREGAEVEPDAAPGPARGHVDRAV